MGRAAGESVGVRSILADPAVGSVVAVALVMMVGVGLVLPVLPLYARSFGVGYGGVGVLIGAYGLARLGADLAAGLVVDRIGERRAAAVGLASLAVFALATGLAPSFPVAVACWAAAGVGSAVVFAALYSHLLRAVPGERMARTLSIFYGSFNAGVIAGGFLGGVLAHHLGLAAPLLFDAGLAALAAILCLRLLPALAPPAAAGPVGARGLRGLGGLLRTPGLLTVAAANLAYMWMVAAVFDTLVPLFAQDELGMSTVGIGVVFAVALAAEFAVLYPAGAAADRHGRRAVLIPALAALAAATCVLGLASTPLVFGVLIALLGIASGVAGVPPGAMLADVAVPGQAGASVGVFRFFGDLGFTLGPLAAGFASSAVGFGAAFVLASVPTAVALALVARAPETMRPPPA